MLDPICIKLRANPARRRTRKPRAAKGCADGI